MMRKTTMRMMMSDAKCAMLMKMGVGFQPIGTLWVIFDSYTNRCSTSHAYRWKYSVKIQRLRSIGTVVRVKRYPSDDILCSHCWDMLKFESFTDQLDQKSTNHECGRMDDGGIGSLSKRLVVILGDQHHPRPVLRVSKHSDYISSTPTLGRLVYSVTRAAVPSSISPANSFICLALRLASM